MLGEDLEILNVDKPDWKLCTCHKYFQMRQQFGDSYISDCLSISQLSYWVIDSFSSGGSYRIQRASVLVKKKNLLIWSFFYWMCWQTFEKGGRVLKKGGRVITSQRRDRQPLVRVRWPLIMVPAEKILTQPTD